MRVLVTGAAGFIGSHIVEYLRERGCQVSGHDIEDGPFVEVQSDLSSPQPFKDIDEHDAICHVGGIGDVYLAAKEPLLAYEVNLLGTQRVVEAAQAGRFEKIIYASTWEVYGSPRYEPLDEEHSTTPDHPYSISKLAGELAVRTALSEVPHVCLRLGTCYGPRMRQNAVIPLFIKKGLEGGTISLQGGGNQFRQFTYVSDICRAFELALAPEAEGVYNIVSPEKITIRQIAEKVQEKCPALGLENAPPRPGDVSPAEVSATRAQAELGWEAQVSFAEGFERVIAWMQGQSGA